jgi:hypothetical protein
VRGLAVELEGAVGVGQVQVGADLDGPVAGVQDDEAQAFVRSAVGVDLDAAGRDPDGARPGGSAG